MPAEKQQAERNPECRALVIGVGNGAGRAVAEMARQWPDGPEMIVLNTELAEPGAGPRQVLIGAKIIRGLGTGGDPQVGRRVAESDAAAIRELLPGANLVFLVVGLGGGTGTGAAPLVVEEARKAGALTLCFAMLPFEFEGAQRQEHARCGLRALEETADGVICLPNQRLFALGEDRANLAEAFRKADAFLGRGVRAVWRVLCRKGVINLGFADVRALLQSGGGPCVFACAEGAGPDKIGIVLRALREDPLLLRGQALSRAQSYLVSIIGGEDFTLQDIDRLARGIAEFGRAEALTMTGVICDPAMADRVFVTILAAEPAGEREAPPAWQPAAAGAAPAGADEVRPASAAQEKRTQGNLFPWSDKGRFMGVDPTIVDGNNLDIPTFIRRGILIQKSRESSG